MMICTNSETLKDIEELQMLGEKLTSIPKDLEIHKKLQKIIENRKLSIKSSKNIDWATAEQLAFGSLINNGSPVRLSGQDCGRGTFSQRHSVFIDQNSEKRYIPLENLSTKYLSA